MAEYPITSLSGSSGNVHYFVSDWSALSDDSMTISFLLITTFPPQRAWAVMALQQHGTPLLPSTVSEFCSSLRQSAALSVTVIAEVFGLWPIKCYSLWMYKFKIRVIKNMYLKIVLEWHNRPLSHYGQINNRPKSNMSMKRHPHFVPSRVWHNFASTILSDLSHSEGKMYFKRFERNLI